MESVTTNANMLNFAIRNPLMNPKQVATRIPTRTPAKIGIPLLVISCPRITEHSASCAPTVRSIPPVVIARHIPKVSRPLIEICVQTFSRFVELRNIGRAIAMPMIMNSMMTLTPYFDMKVRNPSLLKKLVFPFAAILLPPLSSITIHSPFSQKSRPAVNCNSYSPNSFARMLS